MDNEFHKFVFFIHNLITKSRKKTKIIIFNNYLKEKKPSDSKELLQSPAQIYLKQLNYIIKL